MSTLGDCLDQIDARVDVLDAVLGYEHVTARLTAALREIDALCEQQVAKAMTRHLLSRASAEQTAVLWVQDVRDALDRITADTGSEWKPGDPCGVCGSRNTARSTDPTEGAICTDCGAADSDE